MRMSFCAILSASIAFLVYALLAFDAAHTAPKDDAAISMVVMDPLALPLSCPCVAGYAQRKYEVLGDYLSKQLGRPVEVTFAESIKNALDKESVNDVHIIIGKDSVVRAQGGKLELDVSLLARLVGKDGKTTQTGLIVVRSVDPAQKLADLAGYRVLFGPPECDEKFAAARELLEEAGVALPAKKDAEISHACSDGTCMIIDWGDKIRGAAVISSYGAAGHRRAGDRPVVEGDLDLDGGVSARVEDLPRAYGIDARHGGSLTSALAPLHQPRGPGGPRLLRGRGRAPSPVRGVRKGVPHDRRPRNGGRDRQPAAGPLRRPARRRPAADRRLRRGAAPRLVRRTSPAMAAPRRGRVARAVRLREGGRLRRAPPPAVAEDPQRGVRRVGDGVRLRPPGRPPADPRARGRLGGPRAVAARGDRRAAGAGPRRAGGLGPGRGAPARRDRGAAPAQQRAGPHGQLGRGRGGGGLRLLRRRRRPVPLHGVRRSTRPGAGLRGGRRRAGDAQRRRPLRREPARGRARDPRRSPRIRRRRAPPAAASSSPA